MKKIATTVGVIGFLSAVVGLSVNAPSIVNATKDILSGISPNPFTVQPKDIEEWSIEEISSLCVDLTKPKNSKLPYAGLSFVRNFETASFACAKSGRQNKNDNHTISYSHAQYLRENFISSSDILVDLAKSGNSDAIYQLAEIYFLTDVISENSRAEGLMLYNIAHALNNTHATLKLANLFARGFCLTTDFYNNELPITAIDIIEIHKNDKLDTTISGIDIMPKPSIELYESIENRIQEFDGNYSIFNKGNLFCIPDNFQLSMSLFEDALNNKDFYLYANYDIISYASKNGIFKRNLIDYGYEIEKKSNFVREQFQECAKLGNQICQQVLMFSLRDGTFTEKNLSESIKIAKILRDQHHANSILLLAKHYDPFIGNANPMYSNEVMAKKLYNELINFHSDTGALHSVGYDLVEGQLFDKDQNRGIDYLNRAHIRGNVSSSLTLGYFYRKMKSIGRSNSEILDKKKSNQYIKQAAYRSNLSAIYLMLTSDDFELSDIENLSMSKYYISNYGVSNDNMYDIILICRKILNKYAIDDEFCES